MKKNINTDFTINISSLDKENMLLDPIKEGEIQTYAITQKYVSLPSRKHTATTKGKPVMISVSKSNIGKVRSVADWNGK